MLGVFWIETVNNFYDNSGVQGKLRISECFKIRCECKLGFSQLGVVVSFGGKDRMCGKFYRKIAQYSDML